MKPMPNIHSERCVLRLPEPKDSIEMLSFVNENQEHLIPWDPSQGLEYYTEKYWQDKIIQIQEGFSADISCCLNLYLKEDNTLIGLVNYANFVRGAFHSCFLGFKMAENMQKKGLMTEALQASIPYVFDILHIHRISANYMPHNAASAKVLEKCRFQQEGIAEDYLRINGKWEKHVLTSLINQNWKKDA